MFKSILSTALALCALVSAYGQYDVKGVIRDSKTGQALPGATVQLAGSRNFAIADEFGRFALRKVPAGDHQLAFQFVGYKRKSEPVSVNANLNLTIQLEEDVRMTDEVIVYATRARENTPVTYSTVEKQSIDKQNFGQDLPYLLNWTPSVVTTSDAGTGFGYTGVRIRGSDATSINVTINGIPYNDGESLGSFWVDIPDIASSSQSIQIQRGVGSSSNGAGAFGATINLQTNARNDDPYAEVTNSVGFLGTFSEYNSRRHTFSFGTGLLNNHWVLDGRISTIKSEGFIDRATADLSSYYFSAGFYSGNTMIKGIMFGGHERTYQAWYGVPESRLKNDVEAMEITAMNEGWNEEQTQNLLQSNSRTFNPYLYPNQVDDYRQDHFQLHLSQKLSDNINGNLSLHYTPGKGYYEEYRYNDRLSDYRIEPVQIGGETISRTDLIRRRWLDNDFYGFTYSLNYTKNNWDATLGGGWNRYDGDHFGEVIWAEVSPVPHEYRYYYNNGDKRDFNIYAKANHSFTESVSGYLDLQYRTISYAAKGLENKGDYLDIEERFNFFNPKAGLVFAFADNHEAYASFSVANREPVRSDFVNAPGGVVPTHETLYNPEAGYRFSAKGLTLHLNAYLMKYRDQLVHTGMLNDVGAALRTNVKDSYRAGIEAQALVTLSEKFVLNANATFSRNKIKQFDEVLYDYGPDFEDYIEVVRTHRNTDIAFSPSLIAGSGLTYRPFKGFEAAWLLKYVGSQYLDNTSNDSRKIGSYLTNDLRFIYSVKPGFADEITFSLLVNNILDEKYESNGYTWGYLGGGAEYRENYFFPQVGRNVLAMVALKF